MNRASNLDQRISTHKIISEQLKRMSQIDIENALKIAIPIGRGIGGPVSVLEISDTKIFIKRIPLAEIERLPNHIRSTKNYFNLPLFYQYGIGSTGFGSWRELLTHEMTTTWVLEKKCPNFPILFHTKVLPRVVHEPLPLEPFKTLDDYISYWNGSPSIRSRILASNSSVFDIVLFLEYFPNTLNQWIAQQTSAGTAAFLTALVQLEKMLFSTSEFMKMNKMIHFDGHSRNILTDGDQLYFSDFGLALSRNFSLSQNELKFFDAHKNYDLGFSAHILAYETLHHFFGGNRNQITALIKESSKGMQISSLPEAANVLLKRYSPIAAVMDDFFGRIQKIKTTPFPSVELGQACQNAGLGK